MKIAYLILCHQDPEHVARLSNVLTASEYEDEVFVHVDAKSNMFEELSRLVGENPCVHLLPNRTSVYWCGISNVDATMELFEAASRAGDFQRFVILQGADYPIKSQEYIHSFFERNSTTEFIRACNCSISSKKYLYMKARHLVFLDRPNLVKKAWNRATSQFDLKLKPKNLKRKGTSEVWDIFWGCAHIALTSDCVDMILKHKSDKELRSHFTTTFGAEEVYFHTLIYNSPFAAKTPHGGAESDENINRLVDLRNLTYFEYPKEVAVFTETDFERLMDRSELFIRKVNTRTSKDLLDKIDTALQGTNEVKAPLRK